MCRAILVLWAAIGLAILAAAPASAAGTRYPFCLQGNDQPGLSGCAYTSYEQCQATASGRELTCIANPYYVAGPGDDAPASGYYRPLPGRPLPPAGYPRY